MTVFQEMVMESKLLNQINDLGISSAEYVLFRFLWDTRYKEWMTQLFNSEFNSSKIHLNSVQFNSIRNETKWNEMKWNENQCNF